VIPLAGHSGYLRNCKFRVARHRHHSGTVAGIVLRCARLSAGISRVELAVTTGVSAEKLRSWEEGSSLLASVPLPRIAALATSLRQGGASARLVADLEAALWCDLVLLAVAHHEDTTCLMADPITREAAFGELLAWCMAGHVPERFQPYADRGPLLTSPALIRQTTQALWPTRTARESRP
jgi:transcriptional regulator with XRE-family HTH domain